MGRTTLRIFVSALIVILIVRAGLGIMYRASERDLAAGRSNEHTFRANMVGMFVFCLLISVCLAIPLSGWLIEKDHVDNQVSPEILKNVLGLWK